MLSLPQDLESGNPLYELHVITHDRSDDAYLSASCQYGHAGREPFLNMTNRNNEDLEAVFPGDLLAAPR